MNRLKVAVVGYGVIGKRVAHAIALQEDMQLEGVADVVSDWRINSAMTKGYNVFAATEEAAAAMQNAGVVVKGSVEQLLQGSDLVVDCTPKKIAAENVKRYRELGLKFILHGGEKHSTTGHSFNAEYNYETAVGRDCTRVVSCNTTSILRTLGSLKRAGLLAKARGTLLRRATDPWESHLGGIMNTLVPEPEIPSHQGPDAKSVDPELDVVTAAVKVPQTLSHTHYWTVELTRKADKEEVLNAFGASSRILLIDYNNGLVSNNTIKEMFLDAGRPWGDMYEVALWRDMLKVEGNELYYAYTVDNQAIVIPETIDAIRALSGIEPSGPRSISLTDRSLGISN